MFTNQFGFTPVEVEPDPDAERYSNGKGRIFRVWPTEELRLNTKSALTVLPGISPEEVGQPSIENRAVVTFNTFPEFAFLGVECWANSKDKLLIKPTDKPNAQQMCNPLSRVSLVFNTPVFPSEIKKSFTFSPDLAGGRTDYDPWESYRDRSSLNYPKRDGQYRVRLPEVLQAYQPYMLSAAAGSISDEFGRKLPETIKMMFFTDHRKPDVTMWYTEAVLEKNEESDSPLVVTNLKSITTDYVALTPEGAKSGKLVKDIPQVQDIGFKFPLGVREMLDAPSGVIHGTYQTDPVVHKSTYYRTFFAQVTPWSVQCTPRLGTTIP